MRWCGQGPHLHCVVLTYAIIVQVRCASHCYKFCGHMTRNLYTLMADCTSSSVRNTGLRLWSGRCQEHIFMQTMDRVLCCVSLYSHSVRITFIAFRLLSGVLLQSHSIKITFIAFQLAPVGGCNSVSIEFEFRCCRHVGHLEDGCQHIPWRGYMFLAIMKNEFMLECVLLDSCWYRLDCGLSSARFRDSHTYCEGCCDM